MRITRLALILLCLCTAYLHGATPLRAQNIPIDYFTVPPQFLDAALSPNGRFLAAITIHQDRSLLAITDLDAPLSTPSELFEPGGNLGFRQVTWASDNRLLISVPIIMDKSGYRGFGTRLIAMSPRGENVVELVSPDGSDRNVVQDQIVDLLPHDSEHILMSVARSDPQKPEVHKVNIYTGKSKRIENSQRDVSQWMSDHSGTVRLGSGFTKKDYVVKIRNPGQSAWKTLWREPSTSTNLFAPIGFLNNPQKILVASNHEGGPSALYQFDIPSKRFETRIFGHPRVDIESALTDPISKRVLGVEYVLDGSEMHYLDATVAAIADDLKKTLPDKHLRIESIAANGNRVIVYAGSPTDPGRYYIYDKYKHALREFGEVNPLLNEEMLSPMKALTYRTRDGVRIASYLTLPRGIDRTTHPFLPTVILPHGGPTARDQLRYDYQVQFLASRGYAVFQMNFRGSSGYGSAFQESGYGEWGQAMQDDITDGVRHLIAESFADPERICIVGASYGGYAALMGAVKTPDLYQCAASIAGVSDVHAYVMSLKNSRTYALNAPRIGDPVDDEDMLKENSPLYRADEIRIPVLLLHGTLDETVKVSQSEQMAARLSAAGKNHRYIPLVGGDHYLRRENHRVTALKATEALLTEHLN